MNSNIYEYISNKSRKWFWELVLFDIQDALGFIEILLKEHKSIYGFDWFRLLYEWKYQIDQDFCRDYSRFSNEERYSLIKEYFLKSNDKAIFYSISYSSTDNS